MKLIIHFILILFVSINTYANNISQTHTIAIVKVLKTNLRNNNNLYKKNIVNTLNKGTILELESCDKYDWCKLKNQKLYIAKQNLAIMTFEQYIINKKQEDLKKIKKIKRKNNLVKQNIKKEVKKCIKLKNINISEKELFSMKEQGVIFKNYNDKCINAKTIKDILKQVSQFYTNKGYVTTKPFLLPQNINTGNLDVNVSIGYIDKIIDINTSKETSNILFAFVGQTNKVLNLRDIETSLESMNRVPSSKSTFKIKPSKKQGNSTINVQTVKSQEAFDFTLGLSGKENFQDKNPSLVSTLSLYNLLSINDILKFTKNGSYIQKQYQSNNGNEINYSFPISSYILEFIKSHSKYTQGVDGINDIYLSNGNTNTYKVKLSKTIFRDQKNKYKLSFLINHKSSKNYFQNSEIETSSYKTTQIQLDLLHTLIKPWGQIATTYSIYQGKDWFDARDDNYNANESDYKSDAKLEFTKYSLSSSLTYTFVKTYSYTSNLYYLYSKDNLYSSDKLSLGGDSSVRGYAGNYYGNTGWYLHNDITKNIDLNLHEGLLQSTSVYLGLDYGKVPCKNDNENACGEMYGSGIGLRSSAKHFTTDFSLTRALKKLNDEFEIKNNFKYTFTMKF